MPPEASTRLAIIFVLYQNYNEVEEFLSHQPGIPSGVHIIVVDNTAHRSVQRARLTSWEREYGIKTIVAEPENLGYFGAAHFAMQRFDELSEFDYVAISNTDVFFDVSEVYSILDSQKRSYGLVGAIAPQLVARDGKPRAQLHYVSKPARKKYERLVRIFSYYYLGVCHRLAADLKRKFGFGRGGHDLPRVIFAPHGAFMIMTRSYFSATAGFAHPCFLFLEEVTVGVACERAGLRCVYERDIRYSHDNHGVIGTVPSRQIVSFLREAHEALAPVLS